MTRVNIKIILHKIIILSDAILHKIKFLLDAVLHKIIILSDAVLHKISYFVRCYSAQKHFLLERKTAEDV